MNGSVGFARRAGECPGRHACRTGLLEHTREFGAGGAGGHDVVDDRHVQALQLGATLDELAKVLKAAGARRVVNWVVARTL